MRFYLFLKYLIRRWLHGRNVRRAQEQAEWVAGIAKGFSENIGLLATYQTRCECLAAWSDDAECLCNFEKPTHAKVSYRVSPHPNDSTIPPWAEQAMQNYRAMYTPSQQATIQNHLTQIQLEQYERCMNNLTPRQQNGILGSLFGRPF